MTVSRTRCDRRQFLAGCAAGMAAAGLNKGVVAAGRTGGEDGRHTIGGLFDRYGEAVDSGAWPALRRLFALNERLAYFNSAGLGP